MALIAWHAMHPTVLSSTSTLPWAAFPFVFFVGKTFGVDLANRYFVIALISAVFRASQSTPLITPLLLLLPQNLGMRASALNSLGFASHFLTHSSVNFPETVERSGPTLRIPSYPGSL